MVLINTVFVSCFFGLLYYYYYYFLLLFFITKTIILFFFLTSWVLPSFDLLAGPPLGSGTGLFMPVEARVGRVEQAAASLLTVGAAPSTGKKT